MFEAARRSQDAIDAAYREQYAYNGGRPPGRERLRAANSALGAVCWATFAVVDAHDRPLHVALAAFWCFLTILFALEALRPAGDDHSQE